MGRRSLVTFTSIAAALLLVLSACTAPPPDPDPDPGPNAPIQAAVGERHSCALDREGAVWCWGSNERGQLGTGDVFERTVATKVPGISDAVQVTAGEHHTCALLAGRTVSCWGEGEFGVLGQGSTLDSFTPVEVQGVTDVVEVTAGRLHSCARTAGGAVWCWGAAGRVGQAGQQGSGGIITWSGGTTPQQVPGLNGVIRIEAGGAHTCALVTGGWVRCWSATNTYGQLGDGTTGYSMGTPVVVGVPAATSISAGDEHTCASLVNGTVRCWGRDDGRLGRSSPTASSPTPVQVEGVDDAVEVVAGRDESCARDAAGLLSCWGPSATDLSGLGPTTSVELSTGGHGCAVASGGVQCWGPRTYGQLGNADTDTHAATPQLVSPLGSAAAPASGMFASCALMADGTAQCWGRNRSRELGTASVDRSEVPVPVAGLTGATELHMGDLHACALKQDTSVWCWGDNTVGEVGQSTVPLLGVLPGPVFGLTGAVDVSAGGRTSCAVLADGTARCWGWGLTGQLGNGGSLNARLPEVVSGLGDAIAVSTGDAHSCALRAGGTIRCWGSTDFGKLGVRASGVVKVPVDVPSVQDAVAVSAGGNHTCALIADGTVRCWGRNAEGQLGPGYASWSSVDLAANTVNALPVQGITDAVSVSAGTDHTCAVLADGSTRCWGSNHYGQIGDGRRTDAASPVTIAEAGSTSAVSAGERHTCAVATDGATRCWGRNDHRQLGTGASWTSAPVQVVGIT